MQRSIMALDVGEKRIGVAIATTDVNIAYPHTTLANDNELLKKLTDLITQRGITAVVVGLPKNLDGKETAQTEYTKKFIDTLKGAISVSVHTTDEAGTSKKAEETLKSHDKSFNKEDIDALAAAYILEDFLLSHKKTVESLRQS